jgi:putative ABC transport system ATP-binding protein
MNYKFAVDISALEYSWQKDTTPVISIDKLQIKKKEKVFIYGPSGSGKSTLLNLIAGLMIPDKGDIYLNSIKINALNGKKRDRFRADNIGYIYQMFNLIPYLSVIENVTLPCMFSVNRNNVASKNSSLQDSAIRLLTKLDISADLLEDKKVVNLSVGQQQRVAVARSLIGDPNLLLADEPTSALDEDNRKCFLDLLFSCCERANTTLIFVSHDKTLTKHFDRCIELTNMNNV